MNRNCGALSRIALLLSLILLCGLASPGRLAAELREPPMLAAQVAAGTLPPVAARVPSVVGVELPAAPVPVEPPGPPVRPEAPLVRVALRAPRAGPLVLVEPRVAPRASRTLEFPSPGRMVAACL